ncbi:MAG: hypothetical protein ACXV3S_08500, partial [Kineosporiaceae bacterium]
TLSDHVTVNYPASWSLPLAVGTLLVVAGILALAMRRGAIRLRRVLTAWLGLGVGVVAGLATGTGAWFLARLVDPRLGDAVNGASYHRTAFLLAACAAGLAALLLIAWPLRRRHTGLELLGGGLVGAALFGLLLAMTLPTAAYVMTWPVLAGAAALGVLAWRPRSWTVQVALGTLAALPAVVVVAPLVALYFALAARFELTMGIIGTPLPLLWLLTGLAVVVPLVTVALRRLTWRPAVAATGVALALIATGAVVDRADTHPRPDALIYQVDADTGAARWIAVPGVDGFTGQVASGGWRDTTFEADPFHRVGELFAARTVAAPTAPAVAAPSVTVTRNATAGQVRTVELRTAPLPGGYALTVDLRAAGGIHSVAVDGTAVPAATTGQPGQVRVVAFAPAEPVTVAATLGSGHALDVRLTAYRLGFPDGVPPRVQPRTARETAGAYEAADVTVVTRTVTIAPQP